MRISLHSAQANIMPNPGESSNRSIGCVSAQVVDLLD